MSDAFANTRGPISRAQSPILRSKEWRSSAGGELIYGIGDIHGCYDLMAELLAFVVQDYIPRARGRRPVLVFCGDYVDRGPHSDKVLDALCLLMRRDDIEVHPLQGNHEQAMLAFIENPVAGEAWLRCGGAETLAAYGVVAPEPEAPARAYLNARDDLLSRMPAAHLRFLQKLELMVSAGDFAFVHAGVRPGVSLARQSENDLMWMRQGFLDAAGPFEKVIVHGHTWVDDLPQLHEHRIGIDTGSYATGVLTALRLEDDDFSALQVRREPVSSL